MTATVDVETLILAHPNADFDAFAGMLAAQLLYPGARICLHGGVNRNVREFYNLHADQIPTVEPSVLDRDRVRRVVLVEVTEPERLGELAELTRARRCRGDRVRPPRRCASSSTATALVGDDGSVVTGMLRLLLEREARITPMHATAFALGIHEDTGSLTYTSTTPRDIEALAACVRLGANQEQLGRYLRSPLVARAARPAAQAGGRTRGARGRGPARRGRRGARRPLRRGRVVARLARRRHRSTGMRSSCASRWRDACSWSRARRTSALSVDEALEALGGGGHAQAASALVRDSDPDAALERVLAEIGARGPGAAARAAGDVPAGPRGRERRPHRGDARRVPAPRPERDPGVRERPPHRGGLARGPRPRGAPRPQPCARQGRDEQRRRRDRRRRDARGAA